MLTDSSVMLDASEASWKASSDSNMALVSSMAESMSACSTVTLYWHRCRRRPGLVVGSQSRLTYV